jgi:hypothetical protein
MHHLLLQANELILIAKLDELGDGLGLIHDSNNICMN